MENVSIQNWNMIRKSYEVFQKKKILQTKRFYGHVECSFDKQAETLRTKKSEKYGSKCENDWKETCFFESTFISSNDPPVS